MKDLKKLYYQKTGEIVRTHTKNSNGNKVDIKQILASKDEIFIDQAPEPTRERKKLSFAIVFLIMMKI